MRLSRDREKSGFSFPKRRQKEIGKEFDINIDYILIRKVHQNLP